MTDAELAKVFAEGLAHSREQALRAVYLAGYQDALKTVAEQTTEPDPAEAHEHAVEEGQVEESGEREHPRDGGRGAPAKTSRGRSTIHRTKK